MKPALKPSMLVTFLGLALLLTGCGTLNEVNQQYPCGPKPTKEEATKIVQAALRAYRTATVTETGIATTELNPLAGGLAYAALGGTVELKAGVRFADVTQIKVNKNVQGGGFVLYNRAGKKLFPSGITREMAKPEYMNRLLAALLVLCPNVQ